MIIPLLMFSWLMLAAVICFTARTARNRRADQQHIRELEAELAKERDLSFEQRCEMAEKSLALLELKESLESEQQKSNQLLHNILPDRVIHDLQTKGKSEPEEFDQVSVFFSDIVGFTKCSTELDPCRLIEELSAVFTEFDRIFKANGCERIKTIGDAYMAVSGLPVPDADHCRHILRAARQTREFLINRNRTAPLRWEMRMGVHSGKVVGGIVGREKYIYDVFGDTVNTAARMEQLSEPMQINVSQAVRDLAFDDEFHFSARPPAPVKGKGIMQMYFLD